VGGDSLLRALFVFLAFAVPALAFLSIAVMLKPLNPPDDSWRDTDFLPPQPALASVDELVNSLRARFREPDPLSEDETVEKLRLLICVRTLQRWTDADVLAELIGIGLVEEYALDLIGSTRAAGRYRSVEVGTPVIYGRGLPAYWKNPAHDSRLQIAQRASNRLQLARELAGLVGGEADPSPVELAGDVQVLPPAVPSSAAHSDRLRQLVAVACGLAFLGLIALGLYFLD